MRPETRNTLNEINQRFYLQHAGAFDRTRRGPWPGWKRACEPIVAASENRPARIFDAGSGNGRFRDYLASHPSRLHWLGMDLSLALLARAEPAVRASSLCGDLSSGFDLPIREGSCRAVAAFGLFHHIPSYDERLSLLSRLASRLEPRGLLLLTHWQFADEPSIASRILPWDGGVAKGLDIDPTDLETGDHVLGWGESRISKAVATVITSHRWKLAIWFGSRKWRSVDEFFSDGRTGRLNLYRVLRRAPR